MPHRLTLEEAKEVHAALVRLRNWQEVGAVERDFQIICKAAGDKDRHIALVTAPELVMDAFAVAIGIEVKP